RRRTGRVNHRQRVVGGRSRQHAHVPLYCSHAIDWVTDVESIIPGIGFQVPGHANGFALKVDGVFKGVLREQGKGLVEEVNVWVVDGQGEAAGSSHRGGGDVVDTAVVGGRAVVQVGGVADMVVERDRAADAWHYKHGAIAL